MKVHAARYRRPIFALACLLACAAPAAAQSRYVVKGEVVDGRNVGIKHVPIYVEAGGELLGSGASGKDGKYSVAFVADRRPVNVIYSSGAYLPNMLANISGMRTHTVTKVLRPSDAAGPKLSPTEAAMVVATIEHMKSRQGAFGNEWACASWRINKELFPEEFQARVGEIMVAALEEKGRCVRPGPKPKVVRVTREEYNVGRAAYDATPRRGGRRTGRL